MIQETISPDEPTPLGTKGGRGAVLAVIGGGQLARMMAPAASALGVRLRVLVASADDPAAQVIPDCVVGRADDIDAVLALVDGADALTFEHEHVPAAVLAAVKTKGVPVRPGASALLFAQDKVAMRRRLGELGLPCPRWQEVRNSAEAAAFIAEHSGGIVAEDAAIDPSTGFSFGESRPGGVVAKLPRGGYDGRGVRVISSAEEVADWLAAGSVLLEERVDFSREACALVARRPSGQLAAWAVAETAQREGQCFEVTAPMVGIDSRVEAEAAQIAERIADALDVSGVLAVELFQLRDQRDDGARVVVNELAMRPHNSGPWTIEGSITSQFEQHIRACLDWPLGDTGPRQPWSVMVNVLGGPGERIGPEASAEALRDPGVKIHLYGKQSRPLRKVAHVTVSGRDVVDARLRARAAAAVLRGEATTLAQARELDSTTQRGVIW